MFSILQKVMKSFTQKYLLWKCNLHGSTASPFCCWFALSTIICSRYFTHIFLHISPCFWDLGIRYLKPLCSIFGSQEKWKSSVLCSPTEILFVNLLIILCAYYKSSLSICILAMAVCFILRLLFWLSWIYGLCLSHEVFFS